MWQLSIGVDAKLQALAKSVDQHVADTRVLLYRICVNTAPTPREAQLCELPHLDR